MNDLNDSEVYWWRPLDQGVAADTRARILFAAYREMHLNGFHAASLNNILAQAGVSKGALYHHFPNKTELGYAVIDEVITQRIHESFIKPLQYAEEPIQALIDLIERAGCSFTLRDVQLGCPLGVLSQEMAPVDEGFRIRLSRIYEQWHTAIAEAVLRQQQMGKMIDGVIPEQVAVMVVATMEGCLSAGMITQNLDKLMFCGAGLVQYLNLIKKS